MNKEFNQNTRTLIVSFVFALMVMIPLRFVEVSNNANNPMVLGDSITFSEPRIEAPFDVIDNNTDCLNNDYVDQVVFYLWKEKKADFEKQIISFENRRCK